ILVQSMLPDILDAQRYPTEKHLFILDIMRKFELCFPLEGFTDEQYLLPDLLSKEEPETGDWDEALPFQYHYNILPSSIMSRFIVRMNQLIAKRTYWRNGVVLVKGGNKALAKADKEDRKIFIYVKGNPSTRRILLESIRDQFDYIHSTIPGIEVEEKVPLPSRPEVLVDYLNLLDMDKMGVLEFVPSGLREKVQVQDLLAGLETSQDREERLATREDLNRRFDPPPVPAPDPRPARTLRSHDLFYPGLFFLAIAVFALLSVSVAAYKLAIIIIGAVLAVVMMAVLHLRQDDRFSEEGFVTLISELLKSLPFLKGRGSSRQNDSSED
ncbi:MAG: COR domain-containing protein, partial [Phormidesmis sp.]